MAYLLNSYLRQVSLTNTTTMMIYLTTDTLAIKYRNYNKGLPANQISYCYIDHRPNVGSSAIYSLSNNLTYKSELTSPASNEF